MNTKPAINEVTVLCTRHRRKCILSEQSTGELTRIRHMSRVGTPSEPCDSVQFTIRYERETGRDIAYKELAGIQQREREMDGLRLGGVQKSR